MAEPSESAMAPLLFVFSNKGANAEKCIRTLAGITPAKSRQVTSLEEGSSSNCSQHFFQLDNAEVEIGHVQDGFAEADKDGKLVVGEQFSKQLAETGKRIYYPPLVILEEVDKFLDWAKRLRMMFSSIVCAVHCRKENFQSVLDKFSKSTLSDVPVFHINIDAAKKDNRRSQAQYAGCLKKILIHYGSLTPSHALLDLDAALFEGDFLRVMLRTETRTEDDSNVVETVTRLESQQIKRRRIIKKGYMKHWDDMDDSERKRAFNNVAEAFMSFVRAEMWVPESEDIFDAMETAQVPIQYLKTSTVRSHLKRDIFDVYKVLRNGKRIFCAEEANRWEHVADEVIAEVYEKMPPI